MSAAMDTERQALCLPQELTIYTVGELHPQWLAWMTATASAGGEDATLDAASVETVDAAGLQLLASLSRSLADRGLRMHVLQPSTTLQAGCEALGLHDLLLAAQPHPHTPSAGAAA